MNLPASKCCTRFVRITLRFVGIKNIILKSKKLTLKKRFILSRREVVEAATAAARAEVFGINCVLDEVTGKVVHITSSSAFISTFGVETDWHLTMNCHMNVTYHQNQVKLMVKKLK